MGFSQSVIFAIERTATGPLAEAFAVRRYMFRFINRWAKSKKDKEFYEDQKKDVLKWQKKQAKGNATATNLPTVPLAEANDAMVPHANATKVAEANDTTIAPNSTAREEAEAKDTTTSMSKEIVPDDPKSTAGTAAPVSSSKDTLPFPNHIQQQLNVSVESPRPTTQKITASSLALTTNRKRPFFSSNSSPIPFPKRKLTQVQTSPLKSLLPAPSNTQTPPAADSSRPKEDIIHVRHRPIAGPSKQKDEAGVRFRTFGDLSKDSDDGVEWVNNPDPLSDEEDPKEPLKKRSKQNHDNEKKQARSDRKASASRGANYCRPAKPTGVLFKVPCNRCIRRKKECEKDTFSASCVLCYTLKNRCDYGKRLRHGAVMKSKKRANAKGKGKEKAVEMEEVESEDEISEEEDHITQWRDTSAKNRRAKEHADDTDEHMTSGYETSQPPPPSRSPLPLTRP